MLIFDVAFEYSDRNGVKIIFPSHIYMENIKEYLIQLTPKNNHRNDYFKIYLYPSIFVIHSHLFTD